MITLLNGDCREVLKTLPDRSVQCCITSPPYFGLRDYGTGTWNGGDPDCDHTRKVVGGPKQTEGNGSANGHASKADKLARTSCACGATRVDSQIGLEPTPALYVAEMVAVFREMVWLNLGDSFANDTKWGGSTGGKHVSGLHGNTGVGREKRVTGLKAKDLMMIPARVAIALQDDGWYLRSDIIWHKPNPMPESVTDRPTSSHEHIFLLTKKPTYFYDADAVREAAVGLEIGDIDGGAQRNQDGSNANSGRNYRQPNAPSAIKSPHGQGFTRRAKGNAKTFRGGGAYTQGQSFINDAAVERDSHGNAPNETFTRNLRNVWTIATTPFSEAHFATFPPELVERCVKAGSKPGDTILDPFSGAGTTALVADRMGRNAIGIDLNPAYTAMARNRVTDDCPLFANVAAQ